MNTPKGNHWNQIEFSQLVTLKRGQDLTKSDFKHGNIPVAGSNGIIGFHDKANYSGPGVTVGRSGSCGMVQYYENDFWAHNTVLVVDDFKDNHPLFINYYLQFLKLEQFATGASVPTLNRNLFSNLLVNDVSYKEQEKIAFVLSTIQKAIQKQEEIINTTTALKKSLLNKLFTEGTKGESLKQSEAGMIPGSWEPQQIKNIGYDFLGGGTPTTSVKEYWNGDIEWTTSKRLDPERIYIDKGEKLIAAEGLKKSSSNLVPKGNLIVSTRVTVGKVVINNVDLAISQDLTGILIDSSIYNPEFLAYQIQTDRVQQIFQNLKRGATIQGVTRNDMMDIYLGIPRKKDEQDEIARSISAIDKKIAVHKKRKGIYEQLFKSLLNDLMTGAIRVNDVQFNNKSSSELLPAEQSSKTVSP